MSIKILNEENKLEKLILSFDNNGNLYFTRENKLVYQININNNNSPYADASDYSIINDDKDENENEND